MKTFIRSVALAAACGTFAVAQTAHAQAYPTKSVKIVVPYGPAARTTSSRACSPRS